MPHSSFLKYTAHQFKKIPAEKDLVRLDKYITPMASYLTQYFGIDIKDAYALAWSGVPDSKARKDAPLEFEFTMSDGNKITKQETINLSGPFKDSGNEPQFKKLTATCP